MSPGIVLLDAALALLAGALLLPSVSDAISLVRARRGRTTERRRVTGRSPQLLFLVPAHDEELLIASCLRALLQQQYPAERRAITVIADNCTDRTPAVARELGVTCLERRDTTRLGKPHALDWALHRVSLAEIDAVVIVDADTILAPDFAANLAAAGPLRHKAIQPFNGVANDADSALTRMAAVFATATHRFAFGLKNRAGLNVPLSAGMCLGVDVLADTGWSAFSLCEDWEMYALLTARGTRIESLPHARVFAQEAKTLRQSSSQRRRWMAGKMAVLLHYGPGLLRSTHIGPAQKLDALAELGAFGPAVQLAIVTAAACVVFLLRPPAAPWIALALAVPLMRWFIYATAALVVHPQPGRALLAFAFLPLYTIWRAGTALTTLTWPGDQRWLRTPRHADTHTSDAP